ncbi:MAG: hypothetical protein ACK5CA_17605 [Cyanobacteriota bacterium]
MDGVTLTASNFSNGTTIADNDGLCFAGANGGYCGTLDSLTLSFSAPVQLTSYRTGFTFGTTTLTFSQGANSSVQTSFVGGNTTNFNNQFSVAANQPITVTASNPASGSGILQINQLTVTPVPFESDALPVVGSAAFMAGGLWWKRRRGQAKVTDFIAQK